MVYVSANDKTEFGLDFDKGCAYVSDNCKCKSEPELLFYKLHLNFKCAFFFSRSTRV